MELMSSKKHLTIEEQNAMGHWLLANSTNGKPNDGAQKEAAARFGVSRRTVRRFWSKTKQKIQSGAAVIFTSGHKGTIHKDRKKLDVEKVKSLSILERSTIRKMAVKLGVSKSLLGQWIKRKELRPHTSAIKPQLTDVNKIARMKFCLSNVVYDGAMSRYSYQSMHNVVHIDEKWFYMTKTSDRYYLLPEETDPYRACKSKRFITKVMFMCAVTRPQFSADGQELFDGKIGIFPFTTLEVIPAIKEKWPKSDQVKHIFIQQDNAKLHFNKDDPDFQAAANSDGFNIELVCQPANSPDVNVNDLGFFRAIQSLQDDKMAKTVEDLVQNVLISFEELSSVTLNNVFVTLQGCLTEIMRVKGSNEYKIPHINKSRLLRMRMLPECIELDEGLIKDSLTHVMQFDVNAGTNYDIGGLMHHFGFG
ncbi:uncharacterized protein LOC131009952 [Salvia miltiorrhiza]|uniref:uncharacterized protein LOC131009952 n=1 Tax=Salvia miltiorrhiza TaxID=226208 RepID=UPI0025ACA7C0|nr:uncharacterized protein LOC131009952 [Salvia miltiorrhiza]